MSDGHISPMSEQELAELIEAAQRVRQSHASTPADARQLLKDEGVLAENGELSERYKPAAA
jgi:hypothetical protein